MGPARTVVFREKLKVEVKTGRIFLPFYIPDHIWNTNQYEMVMYLLVSSKSCLHLTFSRC